MALAGAPFIAKCEQNVCRLFRLRNRRHTVVTRLLEAWEPDHVVESITGHLGRRMLEHYSHIRLSAKKAALDRLGQRRKATQRSTALSLVPTRLRIPLTFGLSCRSFSAENFPGVFAFRAEIRFCAESLYHEHCLFIAAPRARRRRFVHWIFGGTHGHSG